MGQIGPFGFQAGLNTSTSIFNQPQGSTYIQQGMRFVNGSLIESNGVLQLNSSPISGVNFFNGIYPDSLDTSYRALLSGNGKTYGINSVGVVTDITGATTYGAGIFYLTTSDVLNGIQVISDPIGTGGGWATQWNGTTLSKLTAIDPIILKTVNNFMFAVNSSASSPFLGTSTFQWSNVSDPTTWSAGNSLDFRKGDGDSIVGLSFIGSDLYIFKRFSVGRLSTTSQNISGAVTLGPLTTVSIGLGAQSTLGIDRLPDGRIVFLGSDYHAYLFDGSTMTDISDQQYSYSNVQSLFDQFSYGVTGTGNIGVYVNVFPPRHEVWFSLSNIANSLITPTRVLIYDYHNNIWSSDLEFGTTQLGALAYIPNLVGNYTFSISGSHSVYSAVGDIVNGISGTVYSQDFALSTTRPSSYQWNASIDLSGEGRVFFPRSLLLFHKGTSASTSFTVTYGFDGKSLGNSTTISTSTSYIRTVIPLVSPSTGQSSTGPSTIQIQVVDSNGGGVIFDPFYLSNEVMI